MLAIVTKVFYSSSLAEASLACNKCGARLPGFPSATPFCNGPMDTSSTNFQKGKKGPVIPPASTSCAPGNVVKGWCLRDAPMTAKQPPPHRNYTDAECCAWCVSEPTCRAWNTNAGQVCIFLVKAVVRRLIWHDFFNNGIRSCHSFQLQTCKCNKKTKKQTKN